VDAEPLSDDYVEKMFTTAGAGTNNMVDYFDRMSHGTVDLSGSQVFGWFTLPNARTDFIASGGSITQNGLVDLARSAATAQGVDLSAFPHGVVVMNTFQGVLFGQPGGWAAACDGGNCQPCWLGQEMGHPYGLEHSRRAGSLADYQDAWDIMSTLNGCFMEPGGPYGVFGPGLNAANMRGRGWLDRSRVLHVDSTNGRFPRTVQLRPLHARELPGYLALEIDDYIIEFRDVRGWDVAMPWPAVFVHSFEDNHSYLEQNRDGKEQLLVGDSWELGSEDMPDLPYTRVFVEAIDTANRTATLTLTHRGGRSFPQYAGGARGIPWVDGGGFVGGSLGTPWVDGGGFLAGSGNQSIHVQPGDDLVEVVDQLVAFKSVENLRHGPARDAVQRAAMEQLAHFAETQLGRLNGGNVRIPAELSPGNDISFDQPS
jgi:hypothetical protein